MMSFIAGDRRGRFAPEWALRSSLLVGVSSAILAVATPVVGYAQTATTGKPPQPGDTAATSLTEVVVTARKRDETLLNTPVSVSAFTDQAIATRGITDLNGIADFTPGLKISNDGNSRNDRSNQTIIIRGMTPTYNGNVSVFIDGAPVVASGFVEGVDDVSRVEVIKGPQSATFGRSTFAGAINLVTKQPTNDYHATIDASVASRNGYDIKAAVEGAIVPDKLTFRVQARDYSTDGSYRNSANPEETLGDQSTKSVNLALHATPVENLTVDLFGLYWTDHDGPAATGKLTVQDYNCAAGAAGKALNYTCGALPSISLNRLGANDQIDSLINNTLLHNSTGAFGYVLNPDFDNHFGLERKAWHTHSIIDYDLPQIDAVFSSLTSFDSDDYEVIQDLDLEDSTGMPNPLHASMPTTTESYINWVAGAQFRQRGLSQEFRLQGGAHGPFHWLIGASYVEQDLDNVTNGVIFIGPVAFGQPSRTKTQTLGAFFSLGYDITKQISLSFDGRYQNDEQTLDNLNPVSRVTSESFDNFLPRALLQYKPMRNIMFYVSYSEGVNPGGFNNNLLTYTPAVQAQLATQFGDQLKVQPEKIKDYEGGVKGQFFNGRAQITLDAYHSVWTNQILQNSIVVPTTGANGQVVEGQTVINENIGQTNFTGVELQWNLLPLPGFAIDGSFGYTPSTIEKYTCLTCAQYITGSTNVNGNSLYGTPDTTFNIGFQYNHAIVEGFEGYGRLDYLYQGRIYEDETNLAYIPGSSKVNIRAGVIRGTATVEAYVTNLTDDTTYTEATRNQDVLRGSANDVVVGYPVRRTFGLRYRQTF